MAKSTFRATGKLPPLLESVNFAGSLRRVKFFPIGDFRPGSQSDAVSFCQADRHSPTKTTNRDDDPIGGQTV